MNDAQLSVRLTNLAQLVLELSALTKLTHERIAALEAAMNPPQAQPDVFIRLNLEQPINLLGRQIEDKHIKMTTDEAEELAEHLGQLVKNAEFAAA